MKLSRLEYETLPEGTNLFLETLVLLRAFECKDHKKKKKKKKTDGWMLWAVIADFPVGEEENRFEG